MLKLLFLLFSFVSWVSADCLSYGYDFVDGGGPYCIDTTLSDYFSFGTEFFGCQPSDSQGDITPILIDTLTNEYFCSDIATTPDGVDMVSTCDVADNVLLKSQMLSGNYTVVIEGLTFAWMRDFYISAGPPAVVTQTPTATFNVTITPSATITTTSTSVYSTTIPASTITTPSSTSIKTVTKTPAPVTVTSTSTITRTQTARPVYSKTYTTQTITTSCKTQPPKRDPTCTIHPSKASLAAASGSGVSSSSSPTASTTSLSRRGRIPEQHRAQPRTEQADRALAKRGPDLCTTTVLQNSTIVSIYSTFTAPTSTEIDTTITTSTATITPPPVTIQSGVANFTVTVTAPTKTRTIVVRSTTTVVTTKTIWATITSTKKVAPTGVGCEKS